MEIIVSVSYNWTLARLFDMVRSSNMNNTKTVLDTPNDNPSLKYQNVIVNGKLSLMGSSSESLELLFFFFKEN